jgi:DNA-binding transcriptional ArsR family regulator
MACNQWLRKVAWVGQHDAQPDIAKGVVMDFAPVEQIHIDATPEIVFDVDDDLWSAVGDPTRRRLLDLLLSAGSGTATSLSEHLPVTRQAVAKHLLVLDRVGLVCATPAGRERQYRVHQVQLDRAVAQLAEVGAAWDARLRRIKRSAETVQHGMNPPERGTQDI